MKKYKLLIIYPGMRSLEYTVTARYYISLNGVYNFYGKDKEILHAFPANLTIIEKITEIT